MVDKRILVAFVLGFCVASCTGAVFSYQYYGIMEADYSRGKLTGPTPSDDLSFSVCTPTPENKSPCVVMMTPKFFALKQDYLDTQNRLIECQKKSLTNEQ